MTVQIYDPTIEAKSRHIDFVARPKSLAGLRVGYATGHPQLIEALNRVKDSFNSYPLDRFAQAGATAAMEDEDYFAGICKKVAATRATLVADLQGIGFDVLPSAANFIFARYPGRDGADLAAKLRERSIINIAMISALNRPHELKLHVKAALGNGLTREQIREIILQVAVYCGVPAGIDSTRIAREAFAEIDAEKKKG